MKKIILIGLLSLFSLTIFAQATPSAQVRVANATTAFGINVAIGTTIYDINADKYYVCKTASVSTLTLTTGSANFTLLGGAGVGVGTLTGVTAGMGITGGGTSGTVTVTVDTANASILSRQRAANTYIAKHAAITGATKTKITYDVNGFVTAGADATTADIAASTNKNYVTDAQQTVIGNTSGTNSGDNAVNTNYSSLVTNATHSGDVTGATALTIAAGAVTLAKQADVATGTLFYRKTAGTGAPEVQTLATLKTDLALTGTNGGDQSLTIAGTTSPTIALSGSNTATFAAAGDISLGQTGGTITITGTGKVAVVEDFEQAVDSIANNRCYFVIAHTPVAGTISVQLNGMNLKPTTQYAIVSGKLRVGLAVYQWDKLSISYSY